jgi:mono/diheme cytochrome c family protein
MHAWRNSGLFGALPAACVLCLLAACEVQTYDDAAGRFGNGNAPPPPPPGDPDGGVPDDPLQPVFSSIQSKVLTPTCATASCHSGANPGASLNLEAANSYTMLVGIMSTQEPGLQRVEQGDPNSSYLIMKLSGTADTGTVMPPSGGLDAADIDFIRQWILAGALDDRAQAAAALRVTSLSPAPNSALTSAPAQIVAGFDRDLDVSTVNAMTYTVQRSGGDANFGNGNEVTVTATAISVPGANPRSAVFDLSGVTLLDDTYRVTLAGSGASMIMDIDANALDGEFSGTFPSGNGVAGGNFIAQFSLATPVQTGPTLDEIQAAVFTPSCAGCHSPTGSAAATGLHLQNATASHSTLVGVPSMANSAILRVAPNEPDNSYLIHKLEGTGNGSVMPPPPSAELPPATIDNIRQWITDGALR